MVEEPVFVLPHRQFAVARLAARGLSNKEIANVLGISVHTVRNTLHAVFEKVQVDNRVSLANAFAARRVREAASPCAEDAPRVTQSEPDG